MSAQVANPGITDVPPPVFQLLPPVTDDLHVVHYVAGPRVDEHAPTPPVAAIVVQHMLTGIRPTFTALTEAEVAGISPGEFAARLPDLEREVLGTFADYTTNRPRAVWVHWRMRDAVFGFDVLAQRARVQNVPGHGIPPERRFDLSYYLSRRFGDAFAPRPRLWNAARRNLGEIPDLLEPRTQELAWERGDHAAVLRAVTASVEAISRLFDRVRAEQFVSGEGEPDQGADPRVPVDTISRTSPALIRPDRLPSSPGPHIKLHRDLFDPTRLTERHRALLAELLRAEAFDRSSCVSTRDLARAVDGPSAKETSFKHPVSELRGWECIDTAEGRGGGAWLTPTGRAIAEGAGP
ncbi:hypothetical protein VT84_02860 [Gemmata sp. SH-PL17]|uniref:hypothetical protein n=1 Tax=Gemmata sp. SH-PL17 TaxID=1630693 RepID=UPI00078E813A|nr:hypothetical protein [Gemmata sp. SH-PL17]AMV23321.1 hypothetical protein VT84_02860 [Gemmata sp. SH-PL17]